MVSLRMMRQLSAQSFLFHPFILQLMTSIISFLYSPSGSRSLLLNSFTSAHTWKNFAEKHYLQPEDFILGSNQQHTYWICYIISATSSCFHISKVVQRVRRCARVTTEIRLWYINSFNTWTSIKFIIRFKVRPISQVCKIFHNEFIYLRNLSGCYF